MRVDRVLKQYQPVSDYQEREKVYMDVLKDYSVADIAVSDLAVLLESNWKIKYTPEKIGNSEVRQKEENSRTLREKTAALVATRLCTNTYELAEYKHLALLLDYSTTKEANERNRTDSQTFIHGSKEEKTELFWEKLKPLLGLKESVLEGKTDEELAKNWGAWQLPLEQFSVLDKIIEEAMEIGVEIEPKVVHRMMQFQEISKLPIHMLNCRAGVVANVYYSVINEEDIKKIELPVLEELSQQAPLTFKDYLEDNLDLLGHTDLHIKKQLEKKLQEIGYNNLQGASIGNIRGIAYDFDTAVDVLKTKRPIYVIGENRKLISVIEATGRDGFLKPIANRKQPSVMTEYIDKSKELIQKMIAEKKPLSEEGVKVARMYMAKMVCYEKLLSEKKLGSGSLYQTIGEDEKKFSKAVNMIYKDPVFEGLTKDITIEKLADFVNNHGEVELNRAYVQGQMAQKQEKEVVVNVKV